MNPTTYAALPAGDITEEKKRLSHQASHWWTRERDLLADMLLTRPEGLLVDLGCGEGTLTKAVAAEWPRWKVLGLDTEDRVLPDTGGQNVSFHRMAPNDPLPLKDETADAVYCRFLFQHLRHPEQTLKEILRVLRPGGRVLVLDIDDRGSVFHPPIPALDRIYAHAAKRQHDLGGNRRIGAQIPSLLAQEGFENIEYRVYPVTGQDFGLAGLLEMALGLKLRLLGETPERLSAVRAQAETIPGFVALIPVFVTGAQKP